MATKGTRPPGARGSNSPPPSEGGQPTPTAPIEEVISGTVDAAVGAASSAEGAAKDAKKLYGLMRLPSNNPDSTVVTTTHADGQVTKDTVYQDINNFDYSTLR
jgi:hypothetical protein